MHTSVTSGSDCCLVAFSSLPMALPMSSHQPACQALRHSGSLQSIGNHSTKSFLFQLDACLDVLLLEQPVTNSKLERNPTACSRFITLIPAEILAMAISQDFHILRWHHCRLIQAMSYCMTHTSCSFIVLCNH